MRLRHLPLSFALCALAGQAMAEDFTSRAQAQNYLAAELPRATAANPKYRTLSDGTVSRWLTQEVRFGDNNSVEMRERYTQTRDGKTIPGTHEATFSLADVEISDLTEAGDVTPQGAPARGVLFQCRTPGCVAAKWSGQPSKADKTDISLQDDATRARVLAAFRYLKTSVGP
jgi:hypothetical protein